MWQILGNPVVLREWHLMGLPSDRTSVENAIVATTVETGRWPLLIDPQRQACRWLSQMGTCDRWVLGNMSIFVPVVGTKCVRDR